MGNLSDLLVRASAKEDLGNPPVAVLVLRPIFGCNTRALCTGFSELCGENGSRIRKNMYWNYKQVFMQL